MNNFISERTVCELTGLSRTTIWRLQREGSFPIRRALSPGKVAWLESEVEQWIESRPQIRLDQVESESHSP
jgi:prophage regulatory protein